MLHFMFISSTKEKKTRCSRSPFWLFVSVSQSSLLHSVFMLAAWCLSLTSGLHIWSARRGQPWGLRLQSPVSLTLTPPTVVKLIT